MKKAIIILCILMPLIIAGQSCGPNGIVFYSQTAIDSFQVNYPGCTEIEGHVTITDNSSVKITNLNGLSVLTSIGEGLTICDIDALTSLTGLHNLESIGGYLEIYLFDSLTEVTALEKLETIGGWLMVYGNRSLTSLSGLDNIKNIPGDMEIYDNDLLSECAVLSICSYLNNPNGYTYIAGNIVGCNSIEQVLDSCDANAVSLEERFSTFHPSAYPNPFINSTTIEFNLNGKSKIQFSIFNTIGEIVYQHEDHFDQGTHKVTWSPGPVPAGLYYCMLRSEEGVSVVKMVKQ